MQDNEFVECLLGTLLNLNITTVRLLIRGEEFLGTLFHDSTGWHVRATLGGEVYVDTSRVSSIKFDKILRIATIQY